MRATRLVSPSALLAYVVAAVVATTAVAGHAGARDQGVDLSDIQIDVGNRRDETLHDVGRARTRSRPTKLPCPSVSNDARREARQGADDRASTVPCDEALGRPDGPKDRR